jgi:hypothetical protein
MDALIDRLKLDGKKVRVTLFMGEALEDFLIQQGCHRMFKSV